MSATSMRGKGIIKSAEVDTKRDYFVLSLVLKVDN